VTDLIEELGARIKSLACWRRRRIDPHGAVMPTFEWTTDFYLKTAKSLKLRGNAWVSPIPVWWLNLGLATTAHAKGKALGRPRTDAKIEAKIRKLADQGMGSGKIARTLGIGVSVTQRVLAAWSTGITIRHNRSLQRETRGKIGPKAPF
jgi:hypothetical protein